MTVKSWLGWLNACKRRISEIAVLQDQLRSLSLSSSKHEIRCCNAMMHLRSKRCLRVFNVVTFMGFSSFVSIPSSIFTTPIPFSTWPKTTCLSSRCGVGTVVIKNCEPFVLGPAFAMLSSPSRSCWGGNRAIDHRINKAPLHLTRKTEALSASHFFLRADTRKLVDASGRLIKCCIWFI